MAVVVDREKFKAALRTPSADATKAWSKLESSTLPSSAIKTKQLVRLGIPSDRRGPIWLRLTGGAEIIQSHPKCYEDALASVFENGKGADNPRPPMFGSRTDLSRLFLTDEGVRHAARILCAVAYENPVVEFCPMLPILTVLFLHHMTPAEAFASVSSIVKSDGKSFYKRKPGASGEHRDANTIRSKHSSGGFLISSPKELTVAAEVVRGLVALRLPVVSEHILSLSPDTSKRSRFYDDWLDWTFECLSFDALERVVDCMLFEGKKILYRVGVGVIKASEPAIVRASSTGAAIAAVCSAAESISGDRLLEAGFSVSLSRKSLSSLYDKLASDARPVDGIGKTDLFQRPLPSMSTQSELLNDAQLEQLWSWVPVRYRGGAMQLLYSMAGHGSSVRTLFSRCGANEPLIIIVRSLEGKILGAYLPKSFEQRATDGGRTAEGRRTDGYFGTGETFVFSFSGDRGERFEWVGASVSLSASGESAQLDPPDFFAHASDHYIGIGGQKGLSVNERKKHALWLDVGLGKAASHRCDTFSNEPLHGVEGEFDIGAMEIYAAVNSIANSNP
eukprot:Opistho-2@28293